jgi:hypothetical protein
MPGRSLISVIVGVARASSAGIDGTCLGNGRLRAPTGRRLSKIAHFSGHDPPFRAETMTATEAGDRHLYRLDRPR